MNVKGSRALMLFLAKT
ncbi:unnamed protein product [Gulo gulo]|uniref:Uncharacterized protein n=1 Tax=Gulo gulo TaxID=48420 RepID=A0A9X9Q9U2_GULGU|nr:unnamed protein product [Gulo gulo]